VRGPADGHDGTMKIRATVGLIALAATLALHPANAWAHATVDPTGVVAGVPTVVTLRLGHGCAGSPTVEVSVKVPEQAASFVPSDSAGFQATVTDRVATWSGGQAPADRPLLLRFEMTTAAGAVGALVQLPVAQICRRGQLNWLDLVPPTNGLEDRPVPLIRVFANDDARRAAAGTSPIDDPDAGDVAIGSDSGTPLGLVIVVSLAVAAVAGAAAWWTARRLIARRTVRRFGQDD
jgi:hypothetical protein